ncbi:MAG: recombinase family protein [Anaerosolibacter sp.]|jgi:site-specific DNA recombinase|uniref:recombinase family protein n=1 Tax=Anaerosolibacter sp. TaxID=1872527 RepID=UPI0026225ABA|nr:recombinase family protein [Anaerosolibacter sp.]MDF2547972.1 recombinase family protein [Anaerosolibacter sp.]
MKAAIYSRKSKFTGTGESTQNQIDLCKEYATNYFNISDFIIYEDEGFSGGNTDRPQYQKMIADAIKKKFDVLLCYRLDRISRNVLDFSKTIEMLQTNHISFVSIREQFDTSTPMGRAMMYISSVFAQLERETIAERIKDNMERLALTGRWLGGKRPYGYRSKQIQSIDIEGEKRKLYQLFPIQEEIDVVRLIFDRYLELGTFSKVESYLIQNNIKRTGSFFNKSTLSYILRNPVYCIADKLSYEYFKSRGASIPSENEFNGINGLMAYSKRCENTWTVREEKDWILGVGKHVGVISSKDWIQVQNIAEENHSKAIKTGTSSISLITPLLKCKCGETMKSSSIQKNTDGSVKYFYYVCRRKERTNSGLCDNINLNGFESDQEVVKSLQELALNAESLKGLLSAQMKSFDIQKADTEDKKKSIAGEMNKKKAMIEKLVQSIADSSNTAASKYILEKINIVDAEVKELEKDLASVEDRVEINLLQKLNFEITLDLFARVVDIGNLPFKDQQTLIHRLVDKVVWDGVNIHVYPKDVRFTNSTT